jgi:acetoacetyl-CoA synthetase
LFVVLPQDTELDLPLQELIRRQLREELSPRHVPPPGAGAASHFDGKRVEMPVKRILSGTPVTDAVHTGSIRNPDSLGFFEDLSRRGR